jgi:hypothetical protein
MIEELQKKNYTITFIGTEADTRFVINNLNIDASNTISYDGTAQGLQETMVYTSSARSAYTDKVLKGEDVSKGFYKDFKK